MADRKAEILDAAADLVQSRGFSAFSYQDLSDILGIRKASIHHHFRTKDDLGVALAEHYREGYKVRLDEITRLYEQPWDRLEAYLAMASDIMLSGDKICPAGSLQSGHNVLSEGIRGPAGGPGRTHHGRPPGVTSERSVGGTPALPGAGGPD
jgi:TetR/AcrR family transcriptional repressor of nem operon